MAYQLTRKAKERLNEYAARTGQTTSAVASEAIIYFWENWGEIVAEELEESKAKKARRGRPPSVIEFPGSRPA